MIRRKLARTKRTKLFDLDEHTRSKDANEGYAQSITIRHWTEAFVTPEAKFPPPTPPPRLPAAG